MKIKKFCKETGADKKKAMEYLRQNQWDYERAKAMFLLPKTLDQIDWNGISNALQEAVKDIVEIASKMVEQMGQLLRDAVKEAQKLSENDHTHYRLYRNNDGSITDVPMDDGSVAVDIERKEE